MPPLLPWIIAFVSLAAVGALLVMALWRRKPKLKPLPTEWSLTSRPVFGHDERRVHRQLREALPHHIVLAKLPLVRMCQPNDPQDVRYWYELLGPINVTFAICSTNGRVLAAIDLDNERGGSRRALQIKQAVLGACRVRYLRCPADHLPSIPELQLLVPQSSATPRGPQAAPRQHPTHDPMISGLGSGRRDRSALWRDSSFFHDSFFGADNRSDSRSDHGLQSEFGALSGQGMPPARGASGASAPAWPGSGDDRPAVVVDHPTQRYGTSGPR